jgi:phage terminase large subunit-like protein
VNTTVRQRVPLTAACADRALIPLLPHPAQREFLLLIEEHAIVVAACGRRFGKSRAVAAAALHNLLLVPEADRLVAPGESRYALTVATSREQALILVDHARSLVRASRALSAELVEDTEFELRFRGGRALLAVPCSARSTRGYAASFVAFDEMGHYIDEAQGGPRVATKLWAALTPSVAQFGEHGRIVAISTPSGDGGFFAELFQRCRGGEIDGAASYSAPSSDNPFISPEFLASQEAALGADDFDREYRAVFTAGGAAFIEPDRIRTCVGDWKETLPGDATGWIASFDPAFSKDPAAMAIVGRRPDDPARLIVGHTQRWLPPKTGRLRRRSRSEETSWIEQVVAEAASACARYALHRVLSDQHLAGTMQTEFEKHGLRVQVTPWTSTSKTAALRSLRALVHTERVELPDDPVLVAELGRIRTKPGSDTIETPRSGDSHCDVALAVSAAVLEHETHGPGQPIRVSPLFRRPSSGFPRPGSSRTPA